MSIITTPHLNFRGQAKSALNFYQSIFGGEQMVFTYEQAGNVQNPDEATQIMWGQLKSDKGIHLMAYDVPSFLPHSQGDNAFFVSVRGNDADEIKIYWKKLSSDAEILFNLAPTSWAPLYGMLKDKFGIVWVLDLEFPTNN